MRCFVGTVAKLNDRDEMTAEDWPPLLALYRALRRAAPKQLSTYWHRANLHRSYLDEGTAPQGVDTAERRVLCALNIYEQMRNQWAERTPENRNKMSAEELRIRREGDNKRQAKARARKRQSRTEHEAACYVVDAETGDVTLPSNRPADEEVFDAAAE
jgi:hypothetical protein